MTVQFDGLYLDGVAPSQVQSRLESLDRVSSLRVTKTRKGLPTRILGSLCGSRVKVEGNPQSTWITCFAEPEVTDAIVRWLANAYKGVAIPFCFQLCDGKREAVYHL